jgi:hypothetical protein
MSSPLEESSSTGFIMVLVPLDCLDLLDFVLMLIILIMMEKSNYGSNISNDNQFLELKDLRLVISKLQLF